MTLLIHQLHLLTFAKLVFFFNYSELISGFFFNEAIRKNSKRKNPGRVMFLPQHLTQDTFQRKGKS